MEEEKRRESGEVVCVLHSLFFVILYGTLYAVSTYVVQVKNTFSPRSLCMLDKIVLNMICAIRPVWSE